MAQFSSSSRADELTVKPLPLGEGRQPAVLVMGADNYHDTITLSVEEALSLSEKLTQTCADITKSDTP